MMIFMDPTVQTPPPTPYHSVNGVCYMGCFYRYLKWYLYGQLKEAAPRSGVKGEGRVSGRG